MSKKIIIAGLPNAGKTTYIAALNGLIRKTGATTLTSNGVSKEQNYLNGCTGNWLCYTKVDHSTSEAPHFIDFPLKDTNSDATLTLELPDVKGKLFEDIIGNDFDEELEKYCQGADGLLFFINEVDDIVLKSDVQEAVGKEKQAVDKKEEVVVGAAEMTDMARNILVLKYLRNTIGDVPLVVGVSSWDEEETLFNTIDDYFIKKVPALYNYIRSHFSEYKLYGVSAQGTNYAKGTDGLEEKMESNKRVYVFDTEKHYDITLPIAFLIK